jgi:transglutaminase-like putative cysteine protease
MSKTFFLLEYFLYYRNYKITIMQVIMKKALFILILFVLTIGCSGLSEKTIQRIDKYGHKNASKLVEYVDSLDGSKREYAEFILDNSSDNDLAVLTPAYLDEHLTYALKTKDLPYTKDIPEELFRHFILPLRISQEPFEEWRKKFYDDLYDKVSRVSTINEAIMIADLYYTEGVYFKQTSGRDQGPLLCIKRGYGRCEEMMILQMCVSRAVGIPCRPASAPYWSFTNSNHVWTEVWTPEGWKIVPEAYPVKYRQSSWEIDRALKAPLITTSAFGKYASKDVLESMDYSTEINTTMNYTKVIPTTVTVQDKAGNPIKNANVYYYATTFGGLFVLQTAETDENGVARVEFGESSMFVTAGKDKLIGTGYLSTLKGLNETTITLGNQENFRKEFVAYFPLSRSKDNDFKMSPENKVYRDQMHDLANKRRDQRLLSQKKAVAFLSNYPLMQEDEVEEEYIAKRKKYLEKVELLAGNANNWQQVDEWVSKQDNGDELRAIMNEIVLAWDIKDLIELPDTTAIMNLITIYNDNYNKYKSQVSKAMYVENVISPIFGSNPFPENGYQMDLQKLLIKLQTRDLTQSVNNINNWLENNTVLDTLGSWSYFSGSLTPTQLIDKKHISRRQKVYLFASLLQNAGIPARWKGFLEYYNGKDWVEHKINLMEEKAEEVARVEEDFEIVITVDGKIVEPKPWDNYLIAAHQGGGLISNTWFDMKEKDGRYYVTYYQEAETQLYVEGLIRNKNGDADVKVIPLNSRMDKVELNFQTPASALENNISWKRKTIHNLTKVMEKADLNEGTTLIFVRDNKGNEPQERMLDQLQVKANEFKNKGVNIIVYTQERSEADIDKSKTKYVKYIKGNQVITEDLQLEDYPAIFIFKDNILTSSANGYDMGLVDYLLRMAD